MLRALAACNMVLEVMIWRIALYCNQYYQKSVCRRNHSIKNTQCCIHRRMCIYISQFLTSWEILFVQVDSASVSSNLTNIILSIMKYHKIFFLTLLTYPTAGVRSIECCDISWWDVFISSSDGGCVLYLMIMSFVQSDCTISNVILDAAVTVYYINDKFHLLMLIL